MTIFYFSLRDPVSLDVDSVSRPSMAKDDVAKKKLTNPGSPAAHPEPAYRCFLPDLTGFTGPWLRRTRAYERNLSGIIGT